MHSIVLSIASLLYDQYISFHIVLLLIRFQLYHRIFINERLFQFAIYLRNNSPHSFKVEEFSIFVVSGLKTTSKNVRLVAIEPVFFELYRFVQNYSDLDFSSNSASELLFREANENRHHTPAFMLQRSRSCDDSRDTPVFIQLSKRLFRTGSFFGFSQLVLLRIRSENVPRGNN